MPRLNKQEQLLHRIGSSEMKKTTRAQRVSFQVSLNLPYGCTVGRAQEYVRDAVGSWSGGLDPEDPISKLDWTTVKVVRKRKERKDG